MIKIYRVLIKENLTIKSSISEKVNIKTTVEDSKSD